MNLAHDVCRNEMFSRDDSIRINICFATSASRARYTLRIHNVTWFLLGGGRTIKRSKIMTLKNNKTNRNRLTQTTIIAIHSDSIVAHFIQLIPYQTSVTRNNERTSRDTLDVFGAIWRETVPSRLADAEVWLSSFRKWVWKWLVDEKHCNTRLDASLLFRIPKYYYKTKIPTAPGWWRYPYRVYFGIPTPPPL